jgi:hypothetical protein
VIAHIGATLRDRRWNFFDGFESLLDDREWSRSREHRRMTAMLKKIAFAFIAALVLGNASLAFTQAASASPNAEQGPGMSEYGGAGP